jgi:hypothetical protein
VTRRRRKGTGSCDSREQDEPASKDGTAATLPDAEEPGKAPSKKTTGKVIDAPLAIVASDGRMVVNATHLDLDPTEPDLVRRLVADGFEILLAVVVPRDVRPEVRRETEDALADVAGRIGRRVMRRDGGS